MHAKLTMLLSVTVLPIIAGYVARRMRLVPEGAGKALMTGVMVGGYSLVALLTLWGLELDLSYTWLPVLGTVHILIMLPVGIVAGRLLTRDRAEKGLFGLASGLGNCGFTMGGFVTYVLYGPKGLALAGIYSLIWMPVTVFLSYPVARHYAPGEPSRSLAALMRRCLFDWRSLPLPTSIVAMLLSAYGVKRPEIIETGEIIDILMLAVITVSFFAIGLRLRGENFLSLRKQILSLAVIRFGLGACIGLALAGLTSLTSYPLGGLARSVFIIESFVPTAVTMVAVANMFDLKPREASALFVANTLMYLAVVLPIVLWLFGS